MRAAFAVMVAAAAASVLGCAALPESWTARTRGDDASESTQAKTPAANEGQSTAKTNPPRDLHGEAQPVPSAIAEVDGLDFATTLDQLQRNGTIDAAQRRELEQSIASMDNPQWRRYMASVLASIAKKGDSPVAASLFPAAIGGINSPADPRQPYPLANSPIDPRPGGDPARDLYAPSGRPAITPMEPPHPLGLQATDPPLPDRAAPLNVLANTLANASQSGLPSPFAEAHRPRLGTDPQGATTGWDPRNNRVVPAGFIGGPADQGRYLEAGIGGSDDWKRPLDQAIVALERVTRNPPQSVEESKLHAELRLLYLLAGRVDDARRPIAGISAAEQDFWNEELFGLAAYFDAEKYPHSPARSAAAVDAFRRAALRLGETATLDVKNATFCREVKSYGVITPFAKDEFKPKETVLLYAELENFRSTESGGEFRTRLNGSYQILDERGGRVTDEQLKPIEDVCKNRRRDFFINYFITLPERIYPGRYTLVLTVEDSESRRFGSAEVGFIIME